MSGRELRCILVGTLVDKIKILGECLNWIVNFIWLTMDLLGRSLRVASSGVRW